jgi:hypothetical protein
MINEQFNYFSTYSIFEEKPCRKTDNLKFEGFRAVRRIIMLFWVFAPCRLVGRCQRFGET